MFGLGHVGTKERGKTREVKIFNDDRVAEYYKYRYMIASPSAVELVRSTLNMQCNRNPTFDTNTNSELEFKFLRDSSSPTRATGADFTVIESFLLR